MSKLRNFLQIAQGININPLHLAISRQLDLWNQFGVRHWHPQSAARSVDDIILRYNKFDARVDDYVESVCANLGVECYPAWPRLPEAVELINTMMLMTRGVELGRVFISRLKPGMSIPAHSDRIAPAEKEFPGRVPPAVYYDRYHVVLHSSQGCQFRCGDEVIEMPTGTAWWFNNQLEHEVMNASADDRIHLVVDIHSPQEVYMPPVAQPTEEMQNKLISQGAAPPGA